TFGHQKGDEILVHTARFFQQSIRDEDRFFVSRQGGDEFAALLNLQPRQTEELTPERRLQAAGARLSAEYALSDPIAEYNDNPAVPEGKKLGIKFGYSVCEESMSLDDLLARADAKGPKLPASKV